MNTKQCLSCDNQVPEARVVCKCDQCIEAATAKRFDIGDTVQLSVEAIEYYENRDGRQHDRGDKYCMIRPWEWSYVYWSDLIVEKVLQVNPVIYKVKNIELGFYEFDLEAA